jgi:hypothetical protein
MIRCAAILALVACACAILLRTNRPREEKTENRNKNENLLKSPSYNQQSTLNRTAQALAACILLLLATTGCQVLTYRSATRERFTRSSIGSNLAINSLTVSTDTTGMRSANLQR